MFKLFLQLTLFLDKENKLYNDRKLLGSSILSFYSTWMIAYMELFKASLEGFGIQRFELWAINSLQHYIEMLVLKKKKKRNVIVQTNNFYSILYSKWFCWGKKVKCLLIIPKSNIGGMVVWERHSFSLKNN